MSAFRGEADMPFCIANVCCCGCARNYPLNPGDLIVAECTDPMTTIDIPNLLRQTGDTLEEKSEADGVLTFRIRKK